MANPNLALDAGNMTFAEKKRLLALLKEKEDRNLTGGHLVKIYPDEGPLSWKNYPKHMRFFEAGKTHKERFASYANRTGKTYGLGAYESACHLTGLYPHWWKGRRFDHPIEMWAAGDTSQTTRDIVQKELLGLPGEEGTGMVAADLIANIRRKAGVPDGVESFKVKHVTGGWSYCGLKSFDQGRRSFQGTAKHFIWLDELMGQDVYGECLVRTMTTKGLVIVTATPVQGLTPFVQDFIKTAVKDVDVPSTAIEADINYDE